MSGHVDGVARGRCATAAERVAARRIRGAGGARALHRAQGLGDVDGVSLTVNAVEARSFEVNLIPHTRAVTTLGALAAGRR